MRRSQRLAALLAGDTSGLHPEVVLVRGDGERFVGRAAVEAMFGAASPEARYTVLRLEPGRVVVALEVTGVAGVLCFALEATLDDDLLVRVQVVAP